MTTPTTKIVEDKEPKLATLQAAVGGFIEVVPLPGGDMMIGNEDGMCLDLDQNYEATQIAAQPIRGNVVVLKGDARLT